MAWTGTFRNNSIDMFIGVDGWFGTLGIPTGLPLNPPAAVETGPTGAVFRSPIFLGEIRFAGTGLAVEERDLGFGATIPVFTAGTITGFEVLFNPLLSRVLSSDPTPEQREAALEDFGRMEALILSGTVETEPLSAVALSQSILASFANRDVGPSRAFFSQFSHVYTGSDAGQSLAGFDGPDVLVGLGGDDFLDGAAGDDTLDGGAGSDGLNGGEGSDLYLPGTPGQLFDTVTDGGTGRGDIDTLSYADAPGPVAVDLNFLDGDQSGGAARGLQVGGIEAVIGSPFADTIHGSATPGSEADTLLGGAGDDVLIGYDGSDRLQGGPGFDQLFGGGNGGAFGAGPGDVAVFAADPAFVQVFLAPPGERLVYAPGGGVDRLVGMEFLEIGGAVVPVGNLAPSRATLLVGEPGGGFLTGSDRPDLIVGRAGDETARGRAGADTIDGGEGADLLVGGPGGDVLIGGPGRDASGHDDAANPVLADLRRPGRNAGEAAGDTDFSIEDLVGSSAADRLFGDRGPNVLTGGAGNDRLEGRAGGDVPAGGTGNDRLGGGGGGDELDGGGGRDRLTGGGGNDRLEGRAGGDVLAGGTGNDRLGGGGGGDELDGGGGRERLTGGGGDDTASGGGGRDVLLGGDGADALFGNGGGDRLVGGAGSDTIAGGGGPDRIEGGGGNDVLSGGRGADRFVVRADEGRLLIEDYENRRDGLEVHAEVVRGRIVDGDLHVRLEGGTFLVIEGLARPPADVAFV